jgi:Tfp pilus assembly protein PilV
MIAGRLSPSKHRRSGFGLIEMAVTGVLITAAMAATLQVVGWVAVERRAVERRERAVLEASNLLERISARSWDELSTDTLASIKISDQTASFLPGSALEVKVDPIEEAPARKKISVEIHWRDRSGRTESPVRLVSWVYRRGGPGR